MDNYFHGLSRSEVPSANSLENKQLPGTDRSQYGLMFNLGFHIACLNAEKAFDVVEILCENHPLKDVVVEGVETKLKLLKEKN